MKAHPNLENFPSCPYTGKTCEYCDMDGTLRYECKACKEYGNGVRASKGVADNKIGCLIVCAIYAAWIGLFALLNYLIEKL